jgi:hypothetical protein
MKMKKLPFLFIKLEKFRGQENRMLDDWVRKIKPVIGSWN